MGKNWQELLDNANNGADILGSALSALSELRNESVAQLSSFAKTKGIGIDTEQALALLTRPYTIIRLPPPADQNEVLLVQSLLVPDMPAIGWIVSQDGPFRVSRVTRTMVYFGNVPEWVLEESGWSSPEHNAVVDPTTGLVTLSKGDADSFRTKYGKWLGKQTNGGFALKNQHGFLGLVVQLLKDGISPHPMRPVDKKHWNEHANCDIQLRDYQLSAYETFIQYGGVSMIAPTGAGKMFSGLYLGGHLTKKSIIFAPTSILVEEWKREKELHAPDANIQIMTYAMGFSHLKELQKDEDIIFVMFDELHRLPANEWSRLAFVRNRNDIYTAGATASPYREDDRSELVIALCGPPAAVPWEPLIAKGILNRPKSEVRIVKSDESKYAELENLLHQHPNDRILIFCEGLALGKELSRKIGIPFVSGEVQDNRMAMVESSKHCIVSVVGELGLSFKDLKYVVEYDVSRTGKSRSSSIQRHGRLMHSLLKNTTYLVLFTLDEYHKFGDRLNGIRQELGDVQILDKTGESAKPKSKVVKPKPVMVREPKTEVDSVLMQPVIEKLLAKSYARSSSQVTTERKIHAALRLCWESAITLAELEAGKGLSKSALNNYKVAFKIAEEDGLVTRVGDGWIVNKGKFQNIIKLAERVNK